MLVAIEHKNFNHDRDILNTTKMSKDEVLEVCKNGSSNSCISVWDENEEGCGEFVAMFLNGKELKGEN